jgi:TetR/AcrR family transcriptional regulator
MRSANRIYEGDPAQKLLEVAERLFAARGFAGTSVGEITRAARVSRPVLYYHFGNKEGLYRAVVRAAAEAHEAALARAAAGGDATVVKIRRACWAHAAVGSELARLDAAGGGAPWLGDGTSPTVGACPRLARAVGAVRALVADGVKTGELDSCDPTQAALALVGAAEVSVARLACVPEEPPDPERVDGVVSVVLRGLVRTICRDETSTR